MGCHALFLGTVPDRCEYPRPGESSQHHHTQAVQQRDCGEHQGPGETLLVSLSGWVATPTSAMYQAVSPIGWRKFDYLKVAG